MSKREVQMLKALAGAKGVSQSDILRMLVIEAWEAKFGSQKPKK